MNDYVDLYCLSEALNFLTVVADSDRIDPETRKEIAEAVDHVARALVLVQTERRAA